MAMTPWLTWFDQASGSGNKTVKAARAGLDASNLSRWEGGKTPSAELVIDVARALKRNPLEALVAAGYLTEGEAGLRDVPADPASLEPEELFSALQERLRRRLDETRDERLHRPVMEFDRPISESYGLAAKDVDPSGVDVAGIDPDVSA